MNWKEHPHLFANGKFKIQLGEYYDNEIVGPVWYVPNVAGLTEKFKFSYRADLQADIASINNCQLIARPIEDMTQEEVNRADKTIPYLGTGIDADVEQLKKHIISEPYSMMCKKTFLYLLSIGVYPFDDTEDVIFKPKEQ